MGRPAYTALRVPYLPRSKYTGLHQIRRDRAEAFVADILVNMPFCQVFQARPCQVLSARAKSGNPGRRAAVKVLAAKQMNTIRERPRARGFVAEDNSGKANIFGVEPRSLYTSSPTSDRAARAGLGGQQGLAVVAVCLAVVAAVTFFGRDGPQTLSQVSSGAESRETLSSMAASIKSSL